MEVEFVVEPAVDEDLPQILALQDQWLQVGRVDRYSKDGFLVGSYLPDELSLLIRKNCTVVGRTPDQLAGYMLFDGCTSNPVTLQYQTRMLELINCGALNFQRVCPRSSAAINPAFLKSGLYAQLTERVRAMARDRFDAFFAAVFKINPKMRAHTHVGWVITAEDDEYWWVHLPTTP